MSGYTRDILEKKGMSELDLDLMSKPIRPPNLLGKAREKLDGHRSPRRQQKGCGGE